MAHIHERIDFTASVYVVFENKVLLHKHKKLGIWLPPGGHIELDEDPQQAALREVKEEAGIDIELVGNPTAGLEPSDVRGDITPPKFLNRHFFDEEKTHEHIDMVYYGRATSATVTPEVEGGEITWFTRQEIEAHTELLPDIRRYALAALDELS